MLRILTLITFFFFALNSFAVSQSLGSKKSDIIKAQGINFKEVLSNDGMSYITYLDDKEISSTSYYFSPNNECVLITTLYPKHYINQIIRIFNQEYVAVSEYTYKDYTTSTLIKVIPDGNIIAVEFTKFK